MSHNCNLKLTFAMMTGSASFIDPVLQARYEDLGFVHITGVISPEQVFQLKRLFELHYDRDDNGHAMWNSLYNLSRDKAIDVSEQILSLVAESLKEHVRNFVCPAATFMVKNAVSESTVPLHRDFSVLAEPEFSYMNVWLPIVDTNSENGQLHALRRSHKFFDYPLPMRAKWPYSEFEGLLVEHCDIIDAKAGDAVFYGDKVLHGSSSNTSSRARPVVHFGLLHPDARLMYYHLDEACGHVTVHEVNHQFFFENLWDNPGVRFPVLREFRYDPPAKTAEEVHEWLVQEVLT
jgi:ectoine hydroxylase-related dioxygenase (phytanoyl-CoA dioxygenase family)